jgi:hypothetical protein
MSSIALQGNASGAGTLTIAAPNTASNYTLTLPTQTGTLVSGTTTAGVVAPAGTTTLAPILLTSGTNLTSATAGAIEYDGKVVYGTPIGTQRGIVPTQQYYRLDSALAGSNVTTAQSIFGVGVTLSASTVYEFELVTLLTKTAGTTSHTVGFGFGGTATLNNIIYYTIGNPSSVSSASAGMSGAGSYGIVQTAANTSFLSAQTSASLWLPLIIKGTVSINANGTFIPQYTLSAAPGGAYSTAAGSYIRINPLSASGAATNVGTWA